VRRRTPRPVPAYPWRCPACNALSPAELDALPQAPTRICDACRAERDKWAAELDERWAVDVRAVKR